MNLKKIHFKEDQSIRFDRYLTYSTREKERERVSDFQISF